MAQTKKGKDSFFANLSIRQKLIFSFILIGVLILAQSVISINSTNVFRQNYNAINLQSQIRETALEIRENLESQQALGQEWATGEVGTIRDQYEIISTQNLQLLDRIDQQLGILKTYPNADDLNITYADSVSTKIQNNFTDFNDFMSNEFFTTPGLKIIFDIDTSLKTIGNMAVALQVQTQKGVYLNSTYFNDLVKSGGETTVFVNKVTQLDNIIEVLADPERVARAVDPNIAMAINNDLYTTLITIYDFQLLDYISSTNSRGLPNIIQSLNTIMSGINGTIVNATSSDQTAILEKLDNFQTSVDKITEISNSMISILTETKNLLNTQIGSIKAKVEKLDDLLLSLVNWGSSERSQLAGQFAVIFNNQILTIFLVIIFSIVLVAAVSFFINSQISRPVKSITHWSNMISEGDLSKTQLSTGRSDEIGQLQENFRLMNRNLREIIDEVQKSSSLISDTSDDLSSSAQEINATAEEVSAIAQTMAKGSTEQAEIITTIVQELQSATDVVENVVFQITENLDIIKDLSEQTNILALNTAIEAANAGDMARGFQVIAENIRKMSEQSKRTSRRVSKDSREILEQLRDSFNHITGLIENVASVSEETAASAEEVAASAEEMTASMQNIAASSAILSDQSSESLNKVNRFKLE